MVGLPDQWDTCSRTIHLRGSAEAFAYGGNVIGVDFRSDVVLYDAITGSRMSVLHGDERIDSLAFSLDGTLVVSRHYDIIRLWDVQTGGVIRTFADYTLTTPAVSISSDGTTIAFGTMDGSIGLWDVRTGRCCSIETHQDGAVILIRFSPVNSRRLLSSSEDRIVQQWDVDGHQIGSSYYEADEVEDLAYASDGTRFVSCGGRIVTVRDSESGVLVVKIDTSDHSSDVLNRCCFSSDGRLVVCATEIIILVWDITIPGARLVGRFVHARYICFLASSSSSIISGSNNETVKFWQTSGFLADTTATDQMDAPVPIRSAKLSVEDGVIVTSHSDGVVKTWDLTTGRLKSSFSTPTTGVRDTHLAGDTLIIVWWMDEKECHIWDVYKGRLLRSFPSSMTYLQDLKISGDRSKIFGLNRSGIRAVSMQTGEEVGRVDFETQRWERLFVDGFRVGIKDWNRARGKERGWDFGGPEVSDIRDFSTQPRLCVVGWTPQVYVHGPCWIKDTVTGRRVFRFPGERYMKLTTEIEWYGRYLVFWTSDLGEWPLASVGLVIMDFDPVWPQ